MNVGTDQGVQLRAVSPGVFVEDLGVGSEELHSVVHALFIEFHRVHNAVLRIHQQLEGLARTLIILDT